MKWILGLQLSVCLVLASLLTLSGVSLAETKCTLSQFRKCPVACVSLCDNEEFLRTNAVLCSVGISLTRKDPPDCKKLMETQSSSGDGGEVSKSQVGATDCSTLPILDRKICEAGFPSCAGRVPTLKKNAEILASETRTELSKFGDILVSDFKPKSPQDLCKFRVQDLRRFYEQASGQPGKLQSFSDRYLELQACVKQVEDWFNDYQSAAGGSDLRGAIIDSIKGDVGGLQALMVDTNKNVARIKDVVPVLENLIVMHTFTCPEQ
jgi:hypothetical protein